MNLDYFKRIFSLRADFDAPGTETFILNNIEFKSANAWTLIFAILIASIGLNTNSTAVIIGAMLISPLMGPIVGAGFALGTFDMELFKRCLRNLGIAAAISLVVSTLYFLLSPLTEVSSEILARTRPTVYDLLIALFGGATGIVAASRTEKGNAIPGVAIATALMPPLCSAGYGLSVGDISIFGGALYLFSINSVFIAVATFAFVRFLKFKRRQSAGTAEQQARISRWMLVLIVCMFVPSVFSAWHLKNESDFKLNSKNFILNEFKFPGVFLTKHEVKFSFRKRGLVLNTVGTQLSEEQIASLKQKMESYHLEGAELVLVQSSIVESIENNIRDRLKLTRGSQEVLQAEVAQQRTILNWLSEQGELQKKVTDELKPLFVELEQVRIETRMPSQSEQASRDLVLVIWKNRPSKAVTQKVEAFLRSRLGLADGVGIRHVVGMK
jgi:uncharacterized hydrophobic protein (TIGR00271 family)